MNKLIKTEVSEVRCIQASRCKNTGKEIFTLECSYPRIIHSQLLTHSVFSKNSSSTRAVPTKAAVAQVCSNPAKYMWTENQAGMQGNLVTHPTVLQQAELVYKNALYDATEGVKNLTDLGIHKQNAGRLLEPFQNIKIVLTSTEWENWDWLRLDPDAQGEIADLAKAMKEARDTAEIMELGVGEWHVPYVNREHDAKGLLHYFAEGSNEPLTIEEAQTISVSVCAQTSYRKSDHSLRKALKMKGMLINGRKVHASPWEHCATPVPELLSNTLPVSEFLANMPEGVTHVDRFSTPCSGNFKQWVQLRQLVKGHDKALHE